MSVEARPKIIGSAVQRTEDPRLLTGNGRFIDDISLPRMLHVAFCRSDHAHARIVSINSGDAEAMPGVMGVYTAQDLEGDFQPIRATSRMADYYATEIVPLARDKVRYVGEAVVAVVANNRYLAEDAAENVTIDYDPLGNAIDPLANLSEHSTLLHEDAETNILVTRTFHRGDVDVAMMTPPCVSRILSACIVRHRPL